jgi:DNA-binding CsgD family transcriptional regulator
MDILTNADWHCLNKFLKSLYAPCSLEEFPVQLMTSLSEIVGSEMSGLVNFSLRAETLPRFISFPDPSVGASAEIYYTEKPQDFLAHPVADQYMQTLDGQATAISDLLSESEFHRCDRLYSGLFKHFELEDQMIIHFELPPAWKTLKNVDPFYKNQGQCSLSAGRHRRNFTERDRLVLNLIRPHLKQAYETLVAFSQVHHQLSEQQSATDQAALIALSNSGAVKWITRQAGEILHRYFPPSKAATALPDLLQQWVGRQLSMFAQLEEVCKLARPLRLQLEGRRLTIRFSYCPKVEQLYLLLDETESEQFSVESLQLLGLTKRESEVLFWVAKDKSLVEVAKLLGMSNGTVKKHLEHIYEKFGVQTHLSAVMYALEHLGIFN